MSTPVRTCVACRRKKEQPALVRLAVAPRASDGGGTDAVVVDPERRVPGRGAYVCAHRACIEAALRREGRALVRALRRRPGRATVDVEAIRSGWDAAAERTATNEARSAGGNDERL